MRPQLRRRDGDLDLASVVQAAAGDGGNSSHQQRQRFFSPTRVLDDTINGEPFVPGLTRVPILSNARAHIECEVRQIMTRGDHAVVVLEVVAAECHGDIQPLTVAASPWEYGG